MTVIAAHNTLNLVDERTAHAAGYMMNHSAGIFPGQREAIAAAMNDFAQDWTAPDKWQRCLSVRQDFVAAWATLLDTNPANLCTVESVTGGMALLISAIPQKYLTGRSILIAEDAFPSLHFLLSGLADRYGFTLRIVRKDGAGYVSDDAMIAAWDHSIGFAVVSWISSTSGYRHDLDRLMAHAVTTESLVCADLTQGAGLIPLSVDKVGVDFALTTSLKWACGAPGAGVLYVNDRQLNDCCPEVRGWFSRDNPFDWRLDNFAFAPHAQRFQPGTPSVVSCYAALPGLRWKLAHGLDSNLGHNRRIAGLIIDKAQAAGLQLISPVHDAQRGGTIMIRLATPKSAHEAVEALAKLRISLDARDAILRLSPGEMTDITTAETICDFLQHRTPAV